jgi:hypothetical protein
VFDVFSNGRDEVVSDAIAERTAARAGVEKCDVEGLER